MLADEDLAQLPPRASKHIDRDTAVRWRAVPVKQCVMENQHTLLVPRSFMLPNETGGTVDTELVTSLLARIDMLEKAVYGVSKSEADAGATNVSPMEKARSAKAQQAKSKAVPVTSVPGNEAEVLVPDPDVPDMVEDSKPDTTDNVVPLKAVKPVLTERVADNDEVIESAVETYDDDTISDAVWLNDLREQFGFTAEEAGEHLRKAFILREETTIRKHGIGFVELRLQRALKKQGQTFRNKGETIDTYFKSEQTGYKQWNEGVATPRLAAARPLTRKEFVTDLWRSTTKAKEVARLRKQARLVTQLKGRSGAEKMKNAVNFATVDRMAGTSNVYPTIASWWKAKRLVWQDRADTVRRLLGLATPDRSAVLRAQYEADRDWNDNVADGWKTVNVLSARYKWHALKPLTTRQRMNAIGNELIRRGLYGPLEVTIMQANLQALFDADLMRGEDERVAADEA